MMRPFDFVLLACALVALYFAGFTPELMLDSLYSIVNKIS